MRGLELLIMRKIKGLSQKDAAKELGIDRNTLCKIETSHADIAPATFKTLSEVYIGLETKSRPVWTYGYGRGHYSREEVCLD